MNTTYNTTMAAQSAEAMHAYDLVARIQHVVRTWDEKTTVTFVEVRTEHTIVRFHIDGARNLVLFSDSFEEIRKAVRVDPTGDHTVIQPGGYIL